MEKFLLSFANTFREKYYTAYNECKEFRCGMYQFDDFRPLPYKVVEALGLEQHLDFDDETESVLYCYTTNFSQ